MHFSQFKMMKVRFTEDVIRPVCGGWKLSIDTVTPKPGYTSLATAPYNTPGLRRDVRDRDGDLRAISL